MKKGLFLTIIAGYAMVNVSAQHSAEPMVKTSWHQSAPFIAVAMKDKELPIDSLLPIARLTPTVNCLPCF